MNPNEPYWLQYPKDIIEKGETYLTRHGYQDLTLKRLKGLTDGQAIVLSESNPLTLPLDDRPKAEIVATARTVYLAKAALKSYEEEDIHLTMELMFYLGRSEAVAKLFEFDTGHSPEMATNNSGYLKMAISANEHSKDFKKLMNRMEKTRIAKSNKRSERNDQICSHAKKLLGPGRGNKRKAHDLPKLLEPWCAIQFPDEAIGDKQIRRILQKADIMLPPKPRK